MAYKKRTYYKHEEAKVRDYGLFVIACEGTKTEPSYFAPFNEIDRIKVRLLENKARKTAPSHILQRAKHYIAEEGLNEEYGDSLWCVIDVDKWPTEVIKALGVFCLQTPNCHIAVSNPCFEVWLLYHKLSDLTEIDCSKPHDVKVALSKLTSGGFFGPDYIKLMKTAIVNAKVHDSNPGEKHYIPAFKETKVYALGEALMEKIGKKRWTEFVNISLVEYAKRMYIKNK